MCSQVNGFYCFMYIINRLNTQWILSEFIAGTDLVHLTARLIRLRTFSINSLYWSEADFPFLFLFLSWNVIIFTSSTITARILNNINFLGPFYKQGDNILKFKKSIVQVNYSYFKHMKIKVSKIDTLIEFSLPCWY